jgi:adenosine deaminase
LWIPVLDSLETRKVKCADGSHRRPARDGLFLSEVYSVDPEMDVRTEVFIRNMPKVEIHLHLEGAIPPETLLRFIRRKGGEPGLKTVADLRRKLTYTDFESFIDLWVWKNTFIKYEADFEEIAYGVLEWLSRQQVKYVEAFYGPGDYRRHGLSVEGITERLIEGKERAYRDFGIRCGLIVDLIRDHGPEIGMERVKQLTPYLGKGVIGVGLGGSEQLFPADPYQYVYEEAKSRGFRLTAHAGEVAGAGSIWSAIRKLKAERIGHGLRAHQDPQLIEFLKERQIPLEICVTSNLRTQVCESVREHPVRQYFDQGLKVTVNSDDPAMFNTSLTEEYLTLARELGFTVEEIKRVALNAVDSCFLPAEDKAALRSAFMDQWQGLEQGS